MEFNIEHKRTCFVALFDILGFKDIVKNNSLDSVVITMQETQEEFSFFVHESPLMKTAGEAPTPTVQFKYFSDTFLFHTFGTKDYEFSQILWACLALFYAANQNRMNVRGAITAGEIYVDDNIHVGLPIIKAYEMEQNQEWIGCWVDDAVLPETYRSDLGNYLMRYPVPLKKGTDKDPLALNWIRQFKANNKGITPDGIRNSLYVYNQETSDVAVKEKIENTKRFIESILSAQSA